ncbi:MAG: hypothetical protein IJ385_06330 [Ruminiclostridium sp.]|nr:hypothetical protein [Ruminiclostridium sp.]
MNDKHSEQWDILRLQGKMYQREKIVLYAIIILLIIALVLSNIIWASRHNSETASATTPEITQATEAVALLPFKPETPRRKERVIRDTGG